MDYFGTSLDEHGHYRFELRENSITKLHYDFDKFPFHPEYLTNNLPKGEVMFYQSKEYTVLGISGSCKDTRPETKSIFWLSEIITFNEMKERILNIPIAKRIIENMPFKVRWKNYSQSSSNCNIPHVSKNEAVICEHCGKYKRLQGNGMMHQLCECDSEVAVCDKNLCEHYNKLFNRCKFMNGYCALKKQTDC